MRRVDAATLFEQSDDWNDIRQIGFGLVLMVPEIIRPLFCFFSVLLNTYTNIHTLRTSHTRLAHNNEKLLSLSLSLLCTHGLPYFPSPS